MQTTMMTTQQLQTETAVELARRLPPLAHRLQGNDDLLDRAVILQSIGVILEEMERREQQRTRPEASASGITVPDWVAHEYGLPACHIEIAPEGDDVVIDGLTDSNGAWLDVPAEVAGDLLQRVTDLLYDATEVA